MFFNGERSRVEGHAENLDVWDDSSPEFTEGKGEQLGYDLVDWVRTHVADKIARAQDSLRQLLRSGTERRRIG